LGERLHFDVQGGIQRLKSSFVTGDRTAYGTADLDYIIARHYILGLGWTLFRGGAQNYDQTFVTFGYRF